MGLSTNGTLAASTTAAATFARSGPNKTVLWFLSFSGKDDEGVRYDTDTPIKLKDSQLSGTILSPNEWALRGNKRKGPQLCEVVKYCTGSFATMTVVAHCGERASTRPLPNPNQHY